MVPTMVHCHCFSSIVELPNLCGVTRDKFGCRPTKFTAVGFCEMRRIRTPLISNAAEYVWAHIGARTTGQATNPTKTRTLRRHVPFRFHFRPSLEESMRSPGGRGVLGSSFAGHVPLASQNPYPIIVYSVANYRPHLKSVLSKCHCDFKNGIQCEPTVKY